jgi:hypothetical protein
MAGTLPPALLREIRQQPSNQPGKERINQCNKFSFKDAEPDNQIRTCKTADKTVPRALCVFKSSVPQLDKKFPVYDATCVPYRIHTSLTILLPILSQINPVHALPTYFFKINFNIILSSMRRYSKSCLSFRFTQQNPACTFPPHDRITVITLALNREPCKHLMPSPYTTSALSQLTRLQRRQQNRPLRFRVHITFGAVRKLAFIT